MAGTASGFATVLVTTPTDLLKIRLQLQKGSGGGRIRDMFREAAAVWKEGGARGFTKGWEATALRDTWSTGLYFVAYHTAKRLLYNLTEVQKGGSSPMVELTAGGVAGCVAWGGECDERSEERSDEKGCLAFPLSAAFVLVAFPSSPLPACLPMDVLKTRMQGSKGSKRLVPTLTGIIKEEGMGGLFRGAGPILSRAFLVNGVTFYAYEEACRWLDGSVAK